MSSSDQFGDPRFPRARCAICGFLCIMSQIAEYLLIRLADGASKTVMVCDGCASAPSQSFKLQKLSGGGAG